MVTKVCFKCGKEKPITEFYKHKHMADGHLNKCKECAKIDVQKKYLQNSHSEEYMEKQRARGRDKYLRYKYKKSEIAKLKEEKYEGLRSVKKSFSLFIVPRYTELHHWNYNFIYSVIVLNKRLHARLHTKMEFNLEEGIYYHNSKPLDTIEKHLDLIKSVCEEFEFNFSEVYCLSK